MNANQAVNMIRTIKMDCLASYGFFVGSRDPRLYTDHKGQFMVVESLDEAKLPCRDGTDSNTWAIVGDDLETLVNEAFDYVVGCELP